MGRRRYDNYWPEYIPVAERRAEAEKEIEKLIKKGVKAQPVCIEGKNIAKSFWGKGWCQHIESFSDYENRLPRGRSYVRHGGVCHLEIDKGKITARVKGSSLYKITITIKPLAASKWQAIKQKCAGHIGSLIDLLQGKLDQSVMELVTDQKNGLFPLPGEMSLDCSCPDWADMCKHVAATLYGVGARLDQSPQLLFVLRGVKYEDLVDVKAAISDAVQGKRAGRRIVDQGIADIFGIDVVGAEALVAAETSASAPSFTAEMQKLKKTPLKKSSLPKKKSAPKKEALVIAVVAKKAGRPKKITPFPDPLTGADIRAWRTSLGETQARFAARFDVSSVAVSQWERKGAAPVTMFSVTLALLRKAWEKQQSRT